MELEVDRNSPSTLSWQAVQRLVLVFGATAAASGYDHIQAAVKYCLSLASKVIPHAARCDQKGCCWDGIEGSPPRERLRDDTQAPKYHHCYS